MDQWHSRYNSFNSLKALCHVNYWRPILSGSIPPPISVSIDPHSGCNLNCEYCNSKKAIHDIHASMSEELIDDMVGQLKRWGTKAACIAGGGEPTLCKNFGYLLYKLHEAGVDIGVISNGTRLSRWSEELQLCRWVGISLDAGSSETYAELKGVSEEIFYDVLDNIRAFNEVRGDTQLTIKYLIHPKNHDDIYSACYAAKECGVDLLQIRPGGDSWTDLGKEGFKFTSEEIKIVHDQIDEARRTLEDNSFHIYGVMHKFTEDFAIKRTFGNCYATYITCYFMPDGQVGLCCDRRSDDRLTLCKVSELDKVWGSKEHIDMVRRIRLEDCPRCTLCAVNELFEHCVLRDDMTINFI